MPPEPETFPAERRSLAGRLPLEASPVAKQRRWRDGLWRALLWALAPVYWLPREALSRLPPKPALVLARALFSWVHLVLRSRRQANLRYLLSAAGKTETELRSVHHQYLRFQGRFLTELFRLMRAPPGDLKRSVALQGEAHLREAFQEGRGVLLLGAHYGNWYLVSLLFATLGHAFNSIVNQVIFPPLQRDLERLRQRFGIRARLLGQGGSAAAAAAFARNEIFSTMIDVVVPSRKSAPLPFGAATMQVDLGPARLALRHRVPILMALSHPEEELGRARVQIIRLPSLRGNEAPEEVAGVWLRHLHGEVLQHPEYWWPLGFVSLSPGPRPARQ